MPYRPPRVGQSPYDAAWRKQRMALLREQPLCRMCLAAGRTVAASVVDHIVPLRDGGTNTTDNLQPLCKRCHDAVKTPADLSARSQAEGVDLRVIAVSLTGGIGGVGVIDQRAMRRVFGAGHAWATAHALSLAACEGVVRAAMGGELPRLHGVLVTDDARWARRLGAVLGVPATIHEIGPVPQGEAGSEDAWLAERYGTERDARCATPPGPQTAFATA